MAGIVTRKSNFADLESFEDFEPKSPAVSIQASAAAVPTPPEPPSQERPQAVPEPEIPPEANPYTMANSRKEKADLQRLAHQSGYMINNLVEKPIPARLEPESNTFLKTVRIEVSDWNRFQRWCHANSYSHKKGFKILTQKLPVK
jgi:hypothetical protein